MTDLRKAAQQVLKTWDTDDWFDSDTLRAALAQPEQDLQLVANFLKEYGLEVLEVIAALKTQPEQTAMEPDIAKVLFDNVESLYIEDAQPEPEQEPVAWGCFRNGILLDDLVSDEASVDYWCESDEPEMQKLVKRALYTHPPQRKPLTDEEIVKIRMDCWRVTPLDIYFARAIEKAHGIGVEA